MFLRYHTCLGAGLFSDGCVRWDLISRKPSNFGRSNFWAMMQTNAAIDEWCCRLPRRYDRQALGKTNLEFFTAAFFGRRFSQLKTCFSKSLACACTTQNLLSFDTLLTEIHWRNSEILCPQILEFFRPLQLYERDVSLHSVSHHEQSHSYVGNERKALGCQAQSIELFLFVVFDK